MTSQPPASLVGCFSWAAHCLDYLHSDAKSDWYKTMQSLPVSTWFSGYGCAEQAMAMINAAGHEAFSPAYQYEISARARIVSGQRLPDHVCQYVDIRRLLTNEDRKALEKIETSKSDNMAEEMWEFLRGRLIDDVQMCPRHLQKCLGAGQIEDMFALLFE